MNMQISYQLKDEPETSLLLGFKDLRFRMNPQTFPYGCDVED